MKLKFIINTILSTGICYIHNIFYKKKIMLEVWVTFSSFMQDYICLFFKNASFTRATILNDLTVIDWVVVSKRFEIIYNLFSYVYAFRFYLKFFINEKKGLNSISKVFKNALWLEREAWDMFGVVFFHNPDLRRILTDYGFEGFPLRKDFPLTGYLEVRFDDEKSSLVYEPVELAQNYRFFSFLTPWEDLML